MKRRTGHWTPVDLQMVREFYPIMPKAALAMVMGRTTIAVGLNGARVAVDFMKATDAQTDESGIIAAPKQVTGPQHPKIGVVK